MEDGLTKHVVEGLSESVSNYALAIKCLHERYNLPHLIQMARVHAILKAPLIKDCNGKELCHLYDVAHQHMCALKAMDYKS